MGEKPALRAAWVQLKFSFFFSAAVSLDGCSGGESALEAAAKISAEVQSVPSVPCAGLMERDGCGWCFRGRKV